MTTYSAISSELILIIAAAALFLLGAIDRSGTRRLCAWIAVLTMLLVFGWQAWQNFSEMGTVISDPTNSFHASQFTRFIRTIASGVGVLLLLLAWPTDGRATSNSALDYGTEAGEFFALMLLAITGIFIVAGANDLIVLFLGVELASIPTYIMVSVSRPLPAAQEAGVKYFFLGAMSAAILLFGLSYLYGVTGTTNFRVLSDYFVAAHGKLTSWALLSIVMIIVGLAFKLAAVPLHFYAGDVYQGAATPVTAFLSFVPKTSGLVALIKILFVLGGGIWPAVFPPQIGKLLWIIAVLTMFAGNLLGLLQYNVKRMFAYSSIAHSGYLLVGIAVMVGDPERTHQHAALSACLFYLASYGIMNVGAFGVLMALPARPKQAWESSAALPSRYAASAETLDDLAGAGIKHIGLGLAMAIACLSLTGLPLTVGFFGKFYLIQAAWRGDFFWLIVLMMINAAISAGYYLRVVATMFLRPAEADAQTSPSAAAPLADAYLAWPVIIAVLLSSFTTILFGTYFSATDTLAAGAVSAVEVDPTLGEPLPQTRESRAPTRDSAIIAGPKHSR